VVVKILPTSQLAKKSMVLLLFALAMFALANIVVTVFHQNGGENIFSNLYISISMLITGLAIMASFVTSVISIWKYKERSVLITVPLIIGLLTMFFLIGEIISPH
jgi:hypothetical protein